MQPPANTCVDKTRRKISGCPYTSCIVIMLSYLPMSTSACCLRTARVNKGTSPPPLLHAQPHQLRARAPISTGAACVATATAYRLCTGYLSHLCSLADCIVDEALHFVHRAWHAHGASIQCTCRQYSKRRSQGIFSSEGRGQQSRDRSEVRCKESQGTQTDTPWDKLHTQHGNTILKPCHAQPCLRVYQQLENLCGGLKRQCLCGGLRRR
jgi:hypothetical protein